jgi:hypothetical protein
MLAKWEKAVTLNMGGGGLRMTTLRFSRVLRTIPFTREVADFGPIEQNGVSESVKNKE